MDWQLIGAALGGIGLLLLGMDTMTNGLRLAAGQALRRLLERATGNPLRAVFSGALVTGIVQSSSAVTVAAIGFVNAGLLTFRQAVPVLYGSNVGTTATAWLVALIGFHLDVRLFALPMIGVGMLMRVFAGDRRTGAIGMALVGFGLFFTGIDLMRVSFADLGNNMPLAELVKAGPVGLLIALGLGFVLTLVMQSSSAALTVILTVAAGNMVSLPSAAVMVIGANIGTTSTALIAVLGATANAKRAAAAHFIFNLGTGLIALLLLPILLALLGIAASRMEGGGASAAAVLALFHTTFNVLGVLLFLPLTSHLVDFLSRRFRSAEEDLARPQFLDNTLIDTPTLAVAALARELERTAEISREFAISAINSASRATNTVSEQTVVDRLLEIISDYSQQLQRSSMVPETSDALATALQAIHNIDETVEAAHEVAALSENPPSPRPSFQPELDHFVHDAARLLGNSNSTLDGDLASFDLGYSNLKSRLLRSGSEIELRKIVHYLDRLSAIKRCVHEATKAQRLLQAMQTQQTETNAIKAG